MNKKKVCIIGAGIGGLTAGALLTKKGYDVTIFEKESLIGGRVLTLNFSNLTFDEYKQILSNYNMNIPFSEPDLETIFKKSMLNGYKFDLGYHAIGGGAKSIVNSVLSEIDQHVDLSETSIGLIYNNKVNQRFLSKIDMIKILPNILRLLFASEKTLKKLDSVSMTETIKKYGHGKMKLILEIFSRSITTLNNLDLISTGEMIRAQRNLFKGSKPVGYPKGGLITVTNILEEYIKENSGKINLNTPIEKIIIKNNKVKGIITGKKEYDFDIVISNILVQNLFKIADKKLFPNEYYKELTKLKGTGSLCAYYSFKNINPELIGKTFHFLERNVGVEGNDVVGMIDFMTAVPEANLSPPGNFLVQAYIICSPKEAQDKKILKKLKNLLDENLQKIIPNYKSNLNWAIYPVIWHLDGVAKTINNDKPKIQTPIENLYLVGDCVKAPGIGINCAINSAFILAKSLENSTN